MDVKHLWGRFEAAAQAHPDRVCLRQRHGKLWDFDALTFAETREIVDARARALLELGLAHGDRIAILAHNSVAWLQADLAMLSVGAIVVPIYPSSTPNQVKHVLANSQCRAILVEDADQAAKVAQIREDLPELEAVVSIAPVDGLRRWDDLEPQRASSLDELAERRAHLKADDVATLIYTSGTTGDPKGVQLAHQAFVAEMDSLDQILTASPEDHSLCFLPLSHALERAWSHYVLGKGCAITMVTEPKEIAEYLRRVRPTLFVSVPRLYEKIQQGAREKASSSPLKKTIFEWALRVGGRLQRANRKGKQETLFWRLQLPLADRLVLSSIRDAIGGPKTIMAAGGAALRTDVEEFFSSAGLLVLQGYGMTEAAPLMSFNAPGDFKFGTVGRVMPGGEIKIGPESEIWYRGPNVMKGYWNDPEATAETVDADGFLHTGDIGYVDVDGYLVITDRAKDILVTSGGKNIAPQPIEGELLADPLFEHAILLGNDRPFVTMLLRPSLPDLERLAAQMRIRFEKAEDLIHHEELQKEIHKRVQALSEKLPRHEQIKDFFVTLDPFTQENGLLTPTLKVKRREVEKRFSDAIDGMYAKLAERRKGSGD